MSTAKADKPLFLVTNDDGINAPGIANLVEAVKELGDVVVVAPDKPQSGMGHAITIGQPLRMHKSAVFGDIEAWQVTGTPVDCVKLAVDKILPRRPDFCFSGINHGGNQSISVIYSGTMSAAMEAAIEKIPSVGFSLLDFSLEANFETSQWVVRQVVKMLLKQENEEHMLLNVNIPNVDLELLGGIRICRQAYAKYQEEFDMRTDPHGRKYYWLTGEFKNMDEGDDTDVWALDNNFVSVVPVSIDFTNFKLKKSLEEKWGRTF